MKTTFRRMALGLGAAIAVATIVPAIPASAAPTWGPGPAGSSPRQQCATIHVPLDYADPAGPSIPLAISRLQTAQPGTRRGDLFLIPGGPGNSGLATPTQDAA